MRRVHLICNAHLDPMWLWEWQEGSAEAISTFRTAARLAEETENFVFCHNEALVYEWVENYEPELFAKIQRLVKEGKWFVMGGWYLQPDCNMPSGEGFIRQIERGKAYFKEKFGVDFKTAVNFDSFGHTRGLVQILKKEGYENYLCCRPTMDNVDLPCEFVWVGYDGSEIYARRHFELYSSGLGKARAKIEALVEAKEDDPLCVLWGVGNHGGGPSKKDLEDIARLIPEMKAQGVEIFHSTPDAYFEESKKSNPNPVRVEKSLVHCNTGCYTSQSLVKKKYKELERELFLVEKMMTSASLKGLSPYDEEIKQAERDMVFVQFHDILPGTAIKEVEDMAIKNADHGLEILDRLKARAFFALSKEIGYEAKGNYPVLVYNPLPYEVERTVDVEFQLADQNWENNFTFMRVYDENGEEMPAQIEKERSSINLDWRKRVVFKARLKPSCTSLFECRPYKVEKYPTHGVIVGDLKFSCGKTTVTFNADKGVITAMEKDGKTYLFGETNLCVFCDSEDPWGMNQDAGLGEKEGEFTLLSKEEGSRFSGVKGVIPSCRIVEEGPVRTVVEAVFGYGVSRAYVKYCFNRDSDAVTVEYKVVFGEKDRCLKVCLPVSKNAVPFGNQPFGREELRADGGEFVFREWCGAFDGEQGLFAVADDTFAGSFQDGKLYVNLVRTPAYSGHPIPGREVLLQDRYTDRSDVGERIATFTIAIGSKNDAEKLAVSRKNMPFALSFFPSGKGKSSPTVTLSDEFVEVVSLHVADGKTQIRLYNGTDVARKTTVKFGLEKTETEVSLKPYEYKTFVIVNDVLQEI